MHSANVVLVAYAAMLVALCGCGGGGKRNATNLQSAPPLVIYLHGMVDKNTPDAATSDRVRERFRGAGFDVWEPKGRLGLCDWSEEAKHSV